MPMGPAARSSAVGRSKDPVIHFLRQSEDLFEHGRPDRTAPKWLERRIADSGDESGSDAPG